MRVFYVTDKSHRYYSILCFFISFHSVAQLDITPEDKQVFTQTQQKAINNDALAQYQLAEMYFSGLGVLQNLNSARLCSQ
ncbi:hypothetical protein AB6G58_15320 [Providencia huaxiensis]